LAHEIIRDTKAPSIFLKNERPEFALTKELFLKGGARKVKVLSHSEVYVSVIFLPLKVGMALLQHQKFIISSII